MLLGSVGDKAYATKHRIAPDQSKRANGVVSSWINFRAQCVPCFSVNLFGPSRFNLF